MILILGGSKSGKTAFAEDRARIMASENGRGVCYLASAQAWDEEMSLRIQRHQASRPPEWKTVEETLNVPEWISAQKGDKADIILFDCLTLWLTNLIMTLGEDFRQTEAEAYVDERISDLIDSIRAYSGQILIVSNLVEEGLVSPHFLGRIFQELAGRSHQRLAAVADEVYHVIAGIPGRLK